MSQERIARFREVLEKNPANELARYSLAKALFDCGDFAAAHEHFAAALREKPEWMAAQILLGRCELEMGRKAEAEASLIRARELARKQNHQGPLAEVEELLRRLSP